MWHIPTFQATSPAARLAPFRIDSSLVKLSEDAKIAFAVYSDEATAGEVDGGEIGGRLLLALFKNSWGESASNCTRAGAEEPRVPGLPRKSPSLPDSRKTDLLISTVSRTTISPNPPATYNPRAEYISADTVERKYICSPAFRSIVP
jgi:hypothetical protein